MIAFTKKMRQYREAKRKADLEPCRFYNTPNGCRYGTNCHFSHDSKEQPICHYFNSEEGCRYGSRCRYKHEQRTQVQRKPTRANNMETIAKYMGPQILAALQYGKYGEDWDSDFDGSESDDSTYICFIRPDGDIEQKTVSWCKCNGFFEVSHGYWSGHWYDRKKHKTLKFDDEQAEHARMPSASYFLKRQNSDDEKTDHENAKIKQCHTQNYVQLRFDCTEMQQTNDGWKFRRFTEEEQAKYDDEQQQLQMEEQTESDHSESDCIDPCDSEQECDSDDEDSKDSDDFNPDNYWFSAHDCYVKDDPLPDIVRLASCNDSEGIKKYIANGGDLDKRQRWTEVTEKWGYDKSWEWFNNSALMVAAQKGFVEIVYELLVNQADPMLKSCWADDEYHTALEAAQNVRVNDTNREENMKKIIAMITVVHDLWKKLNPNCNESAHYSKAQPNKKKPNQTLIKNAILDHLETRSNEGK